MPAKSRKEATTPTEQPNRRRSARLAGIDKEKPTESPKITKKEPAKKKAKKTVNDKMSKGDVELDTSVEVKNHTDEVEETSKDETETKEINGKDKEEKEEAMDTEGEKNKEDADFVVVKSTEVPAAESQEVKEAIKAQGEDGELLVNYVQVTHDDVPDAKVVPVAVNGICSTNSLDTDKSEEPHQPVEEVQN